MRRTFHAHAKVNLSLRIFPPDHTGYHPLDTLFCALDFADHIEVAPGAANGIELSVQGADVGSNERNLAYRAAKEFYLATTLPAQIRLTLKKNIPAGTGLGGGSSDAAAVLLALNEVHDSVLSLVDLMTIGARIGSDVPFFLCGSHLAHATGRGEVLELLRPLPTAPILIVVPDFSIATPDAYRWLDEAAQYSAEADTAWKAPASWQEVAQLAGNDFERVLVNRYPQLARLLHALRATQPLIAEISGSGSALFGVYETAARRDQARMELDQRFDTARMLATATCT